MSVRSKTIKVEGIARVEGEGGLTIRLKDNKLTDVKLSIYEPPRFFESLLVGRRYDEAPDITARICGICPVAYLLGAASAIEDAFGMVVPAPIQSLRRLIYCGEWIESHVLHMHLLHAPDFMGYDDAIQLARDHPEIVSRGLRLKKVGNELMTLIGGREVHPVNLRVGGFYKTPSKADLQPVRNSLVWALDASIEITKMVSEFRFPAFEQPYDFVALQHPCDYAIETGRVVSSSGLNVPIQEYEAHFDEEQVQRSTALHGRARSGGRSHVGPLARFAVNYDRLSPAVKALAAEAGVEHPCWNPFKSIAIRALETVAVVEEALRLIDQYEVPESPYVAAEPRAGRGCGATEAPRGICYHRYDFDDQGTIQAARIMPPTAQNLPTIESDLIAFIPKIVDLPDDQIQWQCEQAIRNYDPCISCATHCLRLKVVRES